MNPNPRKQKWLREELLHFLSLSATLAGLCITGVTLFHALGNNSQKETIADDVLAISALLFLMCTFTIFYALRTRHEALASILERAADILLLLALIGMVASGFILVYSVW